MGERVVAAKEPGTDAGEVHPCGRKRDRSLGFNPGTPHHLCCLVTSEAPLGGAPSGCLRHKPHGCPCGCPTDLSFQVLFAISALSPELHGFHKGRCSRAPALGFSGHRDAGTRLAGSCNRVDPCSEPSLGWTPPGHRHLSFQWPEKVAPLRMLYPWPSL